MLKKETSHIWIITVVLLLVWAVLLFRMDEPFWGHHENPPTWMSAAVRTFNQYGADAVNFMVVRTQGPTTPETGWYYMHHPPLIVWIEAVATQFFGYEDDTLAPYESSIRMVAYIATMASLPLFYVIARRLTNARIALIAFLLYATTPVILYFGRSPHYDIMLMPFVLAFIAIFINWMRRYTLWRTVALTCIAILMMWIDWPGAFYLACAGILALIYGNRQQRLGIVVIGIITIIATVAIPVMYEVLRPGSMAEILEILELRRGNTVADENSTRFTAVQFGARYLKDMITTASLTVTILGLFGLIMVAFRKKTLGNSLILGLAVTPFVFMAIVPNSFFFHDWYEMHFLPAFGLGAAILIVRGWQIPPDSLRTRYIKPFIVAIVLTSLGVTAWWTIGLHQTTINNTFGREMAAALPLYTEEDDLIASNATNGVNKIEYYAYRNVTWGFLQDALHEWLQEQDSVDLHYIMCEGERTLDSGYDERLANYDYVQLTDDCRLIHIVIRDTQQSDEG